MLRTYRGIKSKRAARATVDAACKRAIEPLEGRMMLAAHIVGSTTVYPTIQSAVDAASPGATITVDPGNYAELVTVYKTLTIQGAQAGVDARTNTRAANSANESVVTGSTGTSGVSSAFYITANDVTLDGFIVQGATAQYNFGGGIVLAPNIHGTHIVNDIIRNNFTGLLLSNNSSTDPAVIQYDVFLNNNGPGNNNSRGIYSDGGVSGGNLTNVLIDSNAFITNKTNTGGALYEGCVALEGLTAGDQSNITITNNVMDGVGKLLLFNINNLDIEHNVMTHSLDQWSGTFRFEGGDTNVTVKYNTIYDNTGPGLTVDTKGYPVNDANFVVEDNNFYNNNTAYGNKYSLAVTAQSYTGVFDATNNYWGSATGPSGQGTGTGDMAWGNGHYIASGSTGWTTGTGAELILAPYSSTPIGTLDTPYWGVASNAGAPIQAEDYNQGGKNNGYFTSSTTKASTYRPAETVGIEASTDTGGGYDVTSTVAGEWLDYTTNVAFGGTYNIAFRVATAQTTGGKFHLNIDGVNVTGTITAPATGGAQKWQTVTVNNVNIAAGTHILRLMMDSNGSSGSVANFNWLELIPVSVSAPPAAPANLTAVASSATTVNLNWTETSSNQSGFGILRSTDGINFTQVGTVAGNVTTYSDTTVTGGKSYTYEVYATSTVGNSANSIAAAVATPAQATAPAGLSAAAIASNHVNLTWTDTAAGIETGFVIQRSTDGVTFGQVGSVASGVTHFSDTTAAASTSYTYRVFATSPGGNSDFSNTAVASTPAATSITTYLSDLSWVSATAGWNSVQKDLSIADNPLTLGGTVYAKGLGTHALSQIVYNLAGGYTNFISDVGIDSEENGKGTGSVDFQVIGDGKILFDSGVLTNTSPVVSLNVNVTGVNTLTLLASNGVAGSIDFDHADWAGAKLLSSATQPPIAPSNLAAVAQSASQINLAWTNNAPNATGFIIQRSTDGTTFTQAGTVAANVTTFSDTAGLSAGTTYTYRVLATNGAGNSTPSNTATATTPAANSITTYLSDLNWVSATAGWNSVQKDLSIADNPLTLDGVTYQKGLGTHAVSQIVYNLGGAYTNFLSDIGIDSEEVGKGSGSVDFQVIGDGKVLFDSGVLTSSSATVSLNVNVAGVNTLTLLATNGVAGSIDFDHADWAGARLLSSSAQAPLAPSALTAATSSASQINLSWTNNAPNASGFAILRSTDGTTFTQVATTSATSITYADTGLVAGVTYTYEVEATNAGGASAPSNAASATTLSASAVTTYVSDLAWVSATSGWNTVQNDQTVSGNTITLRGVTYAKGLGTHAVSQIVYNLGGAYSNFLSDVGVDDEEIGKGIGSVDFQVIGDGKVLFDSGVLTNSSPIVSVNVNVTGVQQLTLLATNGVTGSIDFDHADWAGARLISTPVNTQMTTNALVSSAMIRTVSAADIINAAAPTVPAPWSNATVGDATLLGSASENAGVFTVSGSGSGIGGTADSFDYACQTLAGNGTLIAHVTSSQTGDNLAGIMIRESLGAGSKQVALVITSKNVKLVHRAKTGGATAAATSKSHVAPQWVKLVRKGNTFIAYDSTDGIHWKKVGSTSIKMNATVYAGLAVTSQDASTLNTATFSDVMIG